MVCISYGKFGVAFHQVKIYSVTIFLVLTSPIILLIALLFNLMRKIVSLSAVLGQKDLDTLLTPVSSIYAVDDLYGIPDWNVVNCFVIKGQLCLAILQNLVSERVTTLTERDGQFVNPKLRQYPYSWYQYWFWKWDEKFDICNHIYVYEKARVSNRLWNEDDLIEIQKNLLRKQWRRQRSPWEIFLIHNFKPKNSNFGDPKCVMFVRYHRCLGEGFTLMTLLAKELCENNQPFYPKAKEKLSQETLSFCDRLRSCCSFPFRITYDFAKQMLETEDENTWKVSESELLKRDHMLVLEKFSKQYIKDIKILNKVSFTAVTLAAISGAVRLTMLEMGFEVPATLRVTTPVPAANHSCKLHCLMTTCCIKLPVGMAIAKERLMACQRNLDELELSTVPLLNFWMTKAVGSLPHKWAKKLIKYRHFLCTGIAANYPGPNDYLNLMGQDIEDFVVSSASNTGFSFTFLSYAENMRITIVIDQRLVPTEVIANKIVKNLYNELVILGDVV